MTKRIREIGLEKAISVNFTEFPALGQRTAGRRLAELCLHIWRTYPEFYRYHSLPEFNWNKILECNCNPFVTISIGAKGMAAGFTEGEGFPSLVRSTEREGDFLPP